MNPTDLAKILDDLGQRLGPTGEHVFQLAIRQVFLMAVAQIVVLLFAAVAGVALVVYGRKLQKETKKAYSSDISAGDIIFWSGAGTLVVTGITVVFALVDVIPRLLNPEYAALRDILRSISGN